MTAFPELLRRAVRLARPRAWLAAAKALRRALGGAPARAEALQRPSDPALSPGHSPVPAVGDGAAPAETLAVAPPVPPPRPVIEIRPLAGHGRAALEPARALAPALPPREDAEAGPRALPRSEFRADSFVNGAGRRAYRLFLPQGAPTADRPLLVMLHGCKQNSEDFALGTRMNELAQARGWVVLYPEQPLTANGLGCWNWFKAGNQRRGFGEPSILAGLVRHVIETEHTDPQRVYVAGLSAGGAMAATLAGTYPELFAAVGIHSGLPHAAAHDVMSAFQAMRDGPLQAPRAEAEPPELMPTIVFHGDLDDTVHPGNGEALIDEVRRASATTAGGAAARSWTRVEHGRVAGGHAWTRTVHTSADGRIQGEHWLVHGSGHAWSGGSPEGSYTDPAGPDASAEMLRFFAAHRREVVVASVA